MQKTFVSTVISCAIAGVALVALDAAAALSPSTPVSLSVTTLAATPDATPILIARRGADNPPGDTRQGRGADNPPGDMRQGRGTDNAVSPSRSGPANPPTSQGTNRGSGNATTQGGHGADNPPGDVRRGRGQDDPPNHG